MDFELIIDNKTENDIDLSPAIKFACSKLSISDVFLLNCKIIISDRFIDDYKQIHFKPDSILPNASTIPLIYQSDDFKTSVSGNNEYENKSIVLINNKKLERCNNVFFLSVVVHELSHCYDYACRLSLFQDKFNILWKNISPGTLMDCIGGYFGAYSETRAKYLQELFVGENHDSSDYNDIFFKKEIVLPDGITIKKEYNFDPIENDDVFYYAQHCAGKLRSWEEMFVHNPAALYRYKENQLVKQIKEDVLREYPYHEIIKDMYDIWDWSYMINKCEELYKRYNGDLNSLLDPNDFS